METIDISFQNLLFFYLLLIFPLWVFSRFSGVKVREILVSVIRMSFQLLLVGLYLKYIFDLNSIWISGMWILVMLLVANFSTLQKAGLRKQVFFVPTMLGISVSTIFVVGFFLWVLVKPDPIYDAQYLIPVTGMILGNCLRGNVLVLERFYSGIRKNHNEYLTYLLLGATHREAIRPYFFDAINAALSPTIATMATVGIVSLPGMMTGQILGGVFPIVAIKYQIAIMISIFTAMTIASVLNVFLSLHASFNEYHILRENIFIG
jgi:putative ABC transport system permease protein